MPTIEIEINNPSEFDPEAICEICNVNTDHIETQVNEYVISGEYDHFANFCHGCATRYQKWLDDVILEDKFRRITLQSSHMRKKLGETGVLV